MIHTSSDLTKAIESQLANDVRLTGVNIERSSRINYDPDLMPWVGVYPGEVDTSPRCLGTLARRWEETMSPILLLQENSLADEGTEAADLLEDLIKNVYLVLDSDIKFGLQHARLLGLSRRYTYVQDDSKSEGDLFFPQCEITLNVSVS